MFQALKVSLGVVKTVRLTLMDLAFGLLFHRFKTIFYRIKTVYCRDRNQQMQSKYSCSKRQGDRKSCSLTYKIPMWAYARQNVPVGSTWSIEMTSFGPEKFFKERGGGQIGVDERSKNLDFDCIMKAFFIERNNTGNRNQKRNQ